MDIIEKREYVGKRMMGMEVLGKRRRERPKRRWLDNIRNDLLERDLSVLGGSAILEEEERELEMGHTDPMGHVYRDLEKHCQNGK